MDGSKIMRDRLATGIGLITTLAQAMAFIDFNTIDITKPNDVIKIAVVLFPAIGGWMSTIKKTEDKPQ